jgi:hypothetical protein
MTVLNRISNLGAPVPSLNSTLRLVLLLAFLDCVRPSRNGALRQATYFVTKLVIE